MFDRLQLTLAPEDIHKISLFREHMPVRLNANARQTAPPLEIRRVPFIPVCRFRIFPVALQSPPSAICSPGSKGRVPPAITVPFEKARSVVIRFLTMS